MRILSFLRLAVLFSLPPLVIAGEIQIVSDPVDLVSGKDAWRVISGGGTSKGNRFVDAMQGGLTPTAGSHFWSGGNAGSTAANRGIARYFDNRIFGLGIYTVSFDIGCFDDMGFPGNFTIALIADTNGDGVYSWGERIPASETNIVSDPSPAPGEWRRWVYSFGIFPGLKTAAGTPVVGAPIGFMILSKVPPGSGYAFDHLIITYAPRNQSAFAPH